MKSILYGGFGLAVLLLAGCDETQQGALGDAPSGDPASPFILGGEAAEDPRHHATVALYDTWYSPPAFFCSGTLIRPDVVLTAAHCLDENWRPDGSYETIDPQWVGVHVGQYIQADPSDTFQASETLIYPGYDRKNIVNDIALIRLETEVPSDVAVPVPELCDDANCEVYGVDMRTDYGPYLAFIDDFVGESLQDHDPEPAEPTASFTYECDDLTCTFDATGSSAAEDATYAWTFGDGHAGSGVTPTHTYGEDGTYTVSLTVTDDGGSDTAEAQVTVEEPATEPEPAEPTASFTYECDDLTCTFDATGSSAAEDATYAWAFGDGHAGSGVTPTHTYGEDGTYTVSLTVTDDGGSDTAEALVTVEGPATDPEPDAIELSVTGVKTRGLNSAELSWSGATSSEVDIFRDGNWVHTTSRTAWTDDLGSRGNPTHTYEVCEWDTDTCSDPVTVSTWN